MRRGGRLGLEIEDLAADHAADAAVSRQLQHELDAHGGIGVRRRIGGDVEGQRQQAVADEDRGGLVVGLVGRRASPAHVVVVHRGQVVVDQRVAVDHFQRAGGTQHAVAADTEEPRRLDEQERPETLAAGEAGITHRFHEAAGLAISPGRTVSMSSRSSMRSVASATALNLSAKSLPSLQRVIGPKPHLRFGLPDRSGVVKAVAGCRAAA